MCRERVGILTTCHACSEQKLEALQRTVDDLSQRLRHPRTGLSDQDAARYRTTIQELDGKLRCAEAQLADKDKIYFKRSGKLTFQLRAALADAVVREGVSMSAAYGTVANSLRHFHGQDCIVGDITHKKAQLRAAISSVAIAGRLTQFVRAWELAAVVSGDGREGTGSGLAWHPNRQEPASRSGGCVSRSSDGGTGSQPGAEGASSAAGAGGESAQAGGSQGVFSQHSSEGTADKDHGDEMFQRAGLQQSCQ